MRLLQPSVSETHLTKLSVQKNLKTNELPSADADVNESEIVPLLSIKRNKIKKIKYEISFYEFN